MTRLPGARARTCERLWRRASLWIVAEVGRAMAPDSKAPRRGSGLPAHDLAPVDAVDVEQRVLEGQQLARELHRFVAVVREDVFSDRSLRLVGIEQDEFDRVHLCHRWCLLLLAPDCQDR